MLDKSFFYNFYHFLVICLAELASLETWYSWREMKEDIIYVSLVLFAIKAQYSHAGIGPGPKSD